MVKLNKYLRELGIDENYWLFKNKKYDERYEEDEDGFVSAEFFDLDTSFALMIYSHLCYFKEYISTMATPGFVYYDKNGRKLSEKQASRRWNQILDSMIEAFKIKIISYEQIKEYLHLDDYSDIEKKCYKIWRKGATNFIRYFDALWY